MKCIRVGLGFVLLFTLAVQYVNAQGGPEAIGVFRDSEFFSRHEGSQNETEELNGGGVIATGLEGMAFRKPIRTEFYDEDANTGELVPALHVEMLFEVSVQEASEKRILRRGDRVTIDYTVTMLDSEWARRVDFCEWNWEDNEEPVVFPLPGDFIRPGSDIAEWQTTFGANLVGFTKISEEIEYCDFEIRDFQGLGTAPLTSNQLLVLPCASFKGTLVVEYNGSCIDEASIRISSNPVSPTGNSDVTLNWINEVQFVDAHAFYEKSAFDTVDDADAIAPDKDPLFDGQTATFDNCTSYDKGLNGIAIDIRNVFCGGPSTLADFVFKTGTDDTPVDWDDGPTPSDIRIEIGGGVEGTDRVWLTWEEGAITDTWLQVQMPGVVTESGQDATFYFGNDPGETGGAGNTSSNLIVNVFDVLNLRQSWLQSADLESTTDFDRSGRVDIFDLLILRRNFKKTFPLITPQAN